MKVIAFHVVKIAYVKVELVQQKKIMKLSVVAAFYILTTIFSTQKYSWKISLA